MDIACQMSYAEEEQSLYNAPSSHRIVRIHVQTIFFHEMVKGEHLMTTESYPRSPKIQVGGLAHLPRLFDKIRMRHKGLLQDYNYLTTGFDKYLLDLLELKGEDLEKRVLEGGTDEELGTWVKQHGKTLTSEEQAQWNDMVLNGGPINEGAQQRFQARLAELAGQRGITIEELPPASTWVDIIEIDEGRM